MKLIDTFVMELIVILVMMLKLMMVKKWNYKWKVNFFLKMAVVLVNMSKTVSTVEITTV